MKLVYESLYEFVRGLDPVKQLGISIYPVIEKFKQDIEYEINNDNVDFSIWKFHSIFISLNNPIEKTAFEYLINEILEYPKELNKQLWLNGYFLEILYQLNKLSKNDILNLLNIFSLADLYSVNLLYNDYFLKILNNYNLLFDPKFKFIAIDNFMRVYNVDSQKAKEWLISKPANTIYSIGIKYQQCELLKLGIQKGATNIAIGNSVALNIATDHNDIELVKMLLKFPEIDPTANTSNGKRYNTDETNYPIRIAARDGKIEIFKLLLNDGRSNLTANRNFALKHAINNGNIEIAKLLLQDKRVIDNLNLLPKTTLTKLKSLKLI
jgi:hypothetical protein